MPLHHADASGANDSDLREDSELVVPHDSPLEAAPPTPIFVQQDLWAHISLMYEKPWRPTYTELERDAPRDRPDCLGVKAIHFAPGLMISLTLWELLGRVVVVGKVSCAWHLLTANASISWPTLEVHRQRVVAQPIVDIEDLWSLKPPPGKPRKRTNKTKGLAAPRPAAPKPLPAPHQPPIVDSPSEPDSVHSGASGGSSAGGGASGGRGSGLLAGTILLYTTISGLHSCKVDSVNAKHIVKRTQPRT